MMPQHHEWLLPVLLVLPLLLAVCGGLIAISLYTRAQHRKAMGLTSSPKQNPTTNATPSENDEPPILPVMFKDVIGQEEAVEKLMDVVLFLKNKEILAQHDARVPRGVLLHGPEGEGKTLLARACANEAGVPFFSVNASDMMEKYIGIGASRVRSLFERARKQAPAIVFIDELDSIGKTRNTNPDSSNEGDVTLNALLGEMDGFDEDPAQVIVLAATNRFDHLDRALIRPGRFDRKIAFKRPKLKDLEKLFQYYTSRKALANDVIINDLARKSVGLSAASVANICNEAALVAAKEQIRSGLGAESKSLITQALLLQMIAAEHMQQARDSVANRIHDTDKKVTFADVIGQPGAIEEVSDIVEFLKDPRELLNQGAQVPSGVLLTGGPGLGKTLIARAIAGEAEVPFFSVSGSDFVEMFVGLGAKRVRDMYEQARRAAPSIVFIDEIDAVGKTRSDKLGSGGNDEREQTLNQLLVEMDGFIDSGAPVITIAATNRPELLDPALRRPGRFDRQVLLDVPDTAARLALLKHYLAGKRVADDVDIEFFARNISGFSGASIEKVSNEAIYIQRRHNKDPKLIASEAITAAALDEAIIRETIGAPRRARIIPEVERRNTAVHEGAGHAAVYHVLSGGKPMARVTIMPNGNSGGHVQLLNDDIRSQTKSELLTNITMALAGRAAQEEILGVVDTGAKSDFEQANQVAMAMVVELGMSELGILPKLQEEHRSELLRQSIESQVKTILTKCEADAREIIRKNRRRCDRIVEILLEKETIRGDEFRKIWNEIADSDSYD